MNLTMSLFWASSLAISFWREVDLAIKTSEKFCILKAVDSIRADSPLDMSSPSSGKREQVLDSEISEA